jgi:anti-sigma regulatory factor (Ser/Thr protein kinase)
MDPGSPQPSRDARPAADVRAGGGRVVSQVFTAVAASVPAARAWTLHHLRGAGVDQEVGERVVLLVSEVATNAVQHTRSSRFRLRLDLTTHVEVWIHDDDHRVLPRPRAAQVGDVGGRGLGLVEALADAWGTRIEPAGAGKWVWFRIDHHPPRY